MVVNNRRLGSNVLGVGSVTWDGDKSSALLRYAEDELDTVYYSIHRPVLPLYKRTKDYSDEYLKGLWEGPALSIRIGDWFIPLAVFTLLVLGGQYMLTGRLTLRFAKKQEDTQT